MSDTDRTESPVYTNNDATPSPTYTDGEQQEESLNERSVSPTEVAYRTASNSLAVANDLHLVQYIR